MPGDAPDSITELLLKWSDGDPDALMRVLLESDESLRKAAGVFAVPS